MKRMTNRTEIERLLNQTGRTLEELPDSYSQIEVGNALRGGANGWTIGGLILHQSDVIELLVGALRYALDKPMQKPLTLEELGQYEDKPVFLEVGFRRPNWDKPKITHSKWYLLRWFGKGAEQYRNYIDFVTSCVPDNDGCYRESFRRTEYGKSWRAWASKPTDEEREAAAWES